jgi:AcrR family transcriptional regulator
MFNQWISQSMTQGEPISAASARAISAQRRQGLREELLAAARDIVDQHGLEQLRARDLAARVGCSLGTIYNLFSDLDALILAVNATSLEALDRAMARIAPQEPLAHCLALAAAYLDYAVENPRLWDALFRYRLPSNKPAPDWFFALQDRAFSHIEAPLTRLCPTMTHADRRLLGRTLFSAVHGVVALGIEQRLTPMALPILQAQISLLVSAIIHGLPVTLGTS